MCVIFVKWVHAIKCTLWQTVAANHEEQMSLLMILVLFQVWEDARYWTHIF